MPAAQPAFPGGIWHPKNTVAPAAAIAISHGGRVFIASRKVALDGTRIRTPIEEISP